MIRKGHLMTLDIRETSEQTAPSMSGRMADAARHAAHLSHEARMVKSLAEDAIEDGVHKAKRAVKSVRRGIERLQDIKDGATYYVKRRPLKIIAVAAGLGLVAGFAAGLIAASSRAARTDTDLS